MLGLQPAPAIVALQFMTISAAYIIVQLFQDTISTCITHTTFPQKLSIQNQGACLSEEADFHTRLDLE